MLLVTVVVGVPEMGRSGTARLDVARRLRLLGQLGRAGPASRQVHRRLGVDHAEAVLVVERVVLRRRAVPEGALLPAGVGGVVLPRGARQDELDVAPGQVGVGAPQERGHPGHDGGRR